MKITKRDAVRIAVAYGEVFDYPLTEEELVTWAPFRVIRPPLAVPQGVALRKRLIAIRNKRAAWSEEKWGRARRVAGLLRLIPTITLVGVTGGLTRSNARKEDDIDFLIITAPKTLWVTRALCTILLDLLHLRRRPGDREFQNLICLNMFMSEDGLAVPSSERDLFTAHEVLLMTPIWERDNTYVNFLRANRWVGTFLPNAWERKKENGKRKNEKKSFFVNLLPFIERPAKKIQLSYMKRRRTTEVVTQNVIRFHPRDARVWIKRALGQRLSRYKIPLDNIFYGR